MDAAVFPYTVMDTVDMTAGQPENCTHKFNPVTIFYTDVAAHDYSHYARHVFICYLIFPLTLNKYPVYPGCCSIILERVGVEISALINQRLPAVLGRGSLKGLFSYPQLWWWSLIVQGALDSLFACFKANISLEIPAPESWKESVSEYLNLARVGGFHMQDSGTSSKHEKATMQRSNTRDNLKAFFLVLSAGTIWSFGTLIVRYMQTAHSYQWQYLFYRGMTVAALLPIYLLTREGFAVFSVSLRFRREAPKFATIALAGVLCALVTLLIIHFKNDTLAMPFRNGYLSILHGVIVGFGLILYSSGSKILPVILKVRK